MRFDRKRLLRNDKKRNKKKENEIQFHLGLIAGAASISQARPPGLANSVPVRVICLATRTR